MVLNSLLLFIYYSFIYYSKKHMPGLTELGVKYWVRYVDDTFIILDSEDSKPGILKYLNDRHPNISFTMEDERSNRIPFLDVLIKRKGMY